MKNLLRELLKDRSINSLKKDDKISYVTIPSALVYLICKSLGLELNELDSIKFFQIVSQLPKEFQFQVFSQFIIDEGHFKGTTFTVAQQKPETRKGFLLLLDSLGIKHSSPRNDKHDITIYGVNFPKILNYLDEAKDKYNKLAGFWFKEEQFREICKKANPNNSYKLIKNKLKVIS